MIAAALLAALLGVPAPAAAEHGGVHEKWFNIGVKVGYTFGHGFTLGVEASVTQLDRPVVTNPLGTGWALNADTNFKDVSKLRLGAQAFFWFVGVEGGPTLVFTPRGTSFGLGGTAWAGGLIIPHYAFTFTADGDTYHELATYLKWHCQYHPETECVGLGTGGGGGDGDSDFDD